MRPVYPVHLASSGAVAGIEDDGLRRATHRIRGQKSVCVVK